MIVRWRPAPAQARDFHQNYFVQLAHDLRSIILLQYTANGGGSTNSFAVTAPSGLITDPFLKTEAITSTYFLGVSNYAGEGQEDTSDHLVLALNDTFAAGILAFDFETLFPGFNEGDLNSALDLVGSPDTPDNLADKDLAFDLIGNFSDQLRGNGGTFASVGTFGLVGFSTASVLGVGESSITVVGGGGGVVPQPASWALRITGFGGAGAMLRRRGAKPPFVAA